MEEHLSLPCDPAGYGDFTFDYEGTTLRVAFEYYTDGVDRLGLLQFERCSEFRMSGNLDEQTLMGYDTVYRSEERIYRSWKLNNFAFMLSGSDFQFFVAAENCVFIPDASGARPHAGDS
jgi:hypothetical protein